MRPGSTQQFRIGQAPSDHAQMMRYRIVDLSLDGRRALMMDADRQAHVVSLPHRGLDRGTWLDGRPAKPGAHVLVVRGDGEALHVRFESVGCSQQVALALMHPVDTGSPGVPAGPSKHDTGAMHEPA